MYKKILVLVVCLCVKVYSLQDVTENADTIVFTLKFNKPSKFNRSVLPTGVYNQNWWLSCRILWSYYERWYRFYLRLNDSIIQFYFTLGYVLSLYRIPPKMRTSKVVFLMHGMLVSAIDFLVLGPYENKALGKHSFCFKVFILEN